MTEKGRFRLFTNDQISAIGIDLKSGSWHLNCLDSQRITTWMIVIDQKGHLAYDAIKYGLTWPWGYGIVCALFIFGSAGHRSVLLKVHN
jgi:hypothetical protein